MRKHGEYKMPGGKLIVADLSVVNGLLAAVAVSGDFFLEPDTALESINAALSGQAVNATEAELSACITAQLPDDVQMYGMSPEAVAVAVRRAIESEDIA
jgi:lipoate-protein ligase A